MAITRINEFHAAPDQAAALHDSLSAVIGAIESAPGCLGCQLLRAQGDPASLVIVERWESVAAHQAAATRIPAEQLAAVRPLLANPPAGRYYDED